MLCCRFLCFFSLSYILSFLVSHQFLSPGEWTLVILFLNFFLVIFKISQNQFPSVLCVFNFNRVPFLAFSIIGNTVYRLYEHYVLLVFISFSSGHIINDHGQLLKHNKSWISNYFKYVELLIPPTWSN